MSNIKSIVINPKCHYFNKRFLDCQHLVTITDENNKVSKLSLAGRSINNLYKSYIPSELKAHFEYKYEKILFDEDLYTVIDNPISTNPINPIYNTYFNNYCNIM